MTDWTWRGGQRMTPRAPKPPRNVAGPPPKDGTPDFNPGDDEYRAWFFDNPDTSEPTVHVGDNDASVTGTIYGPKGQVLKKLRRPFGFGRTQ